MKPHSPARDRLTHLKRRAIAKVRGRQDLAALVRQGLQLGDVTFIADDVFLDPGHPWLITIGDGATLSGGVMILAHDASMRLHTGRTLIGRVDIGKRVYLGARSLVLPRTTIGDDTVVGAGAVVRGEIPPGSIVVGNPAKVVSDVLSFAKRHNDAAADAPVWPHEGWMSGRGITGERQCAQRDALSDRAAGYLLGSELLREDGSE